MTMRPEVRICIDTCAYTAFRNGSRRALDLFDTCDELIFPVTVIGELNFGFSCGSRYAANMGTLSDFIVQSAARIAPVTAETAYRYGRLAAELRARAVQCRRTTSGSRQ